MLKPIHTLVAGAAAALLAGCAIAGSSPSQPTAQSLTANAYPLGAYNATFGAGQLHAGTSHGGASYDATGPLLYVCNLGAGEIDVFHQGIKNQTPIAKITNGILGPGGLTTDNKRNLYVADEGPINGKWTVQMYAPGATSPTKSYTTDLSSPTDTAVALDGTIYIANFNGAKNGYVAVYPKGAVSKEYRLSDFGGGSPLEVALDSKANLYVMYQASSGSGSAVNKYAPGAKTGTNLNLQFQNGGGIQVDSTGNIIVAQQLGPSEVLIFPPGKTKPSHVVTMPGGGEPFAMALNYASKALFVGEFQSANQVDRFAYPTAKFQYKIASGFNNPSGVAASPSEF